MSEKKYLTINEISKKTQVPEYTIRYWEDKFKLLRPLRLESGHRRYTVKELELISEIKDLVLVKGYSLAGAKKTLLARHKNNPNSAGAAHSEAALGILEDIKKELRKIVTEC